MAILQSRLVALAILNICVVAILQSCLVATLWRSLNLERWDDNWHHMLEEAKTNLDGDINCL